MRYFVGDQIELHDAMLEVWNRQKQAGQPRTTFSETAWRNGKVKSRPTCIWTKDLKGESLLRVVLQEQGIAFTESDERIDPRKKKWSF